MHCSKSFRFHFMEHISHVSFCLRELCEILRYCCFDVIVSFVKSDFTAFLVSCELCEILRYCRSGVASLGTKIKPLLSLS